MIWYILLAIAALIAVLLIIVAMQPAAFRISRGTTINAPPQAVFSQVNDFHNWAAWSPWEKMDPNLKRTYSGPSSGVGATYQWAGNKKVGEGRMTILDSTPSSLIRIKLEFLKPFAATNIAEFNFTPKGPQTDVEWSMTGSKNFMMKMFTLMMNMDKLVGGDFEKGLANMKSVAEAGTTK